MIATVSESLSQKYSRILSMCEHSLKSDGVYTQIRCPVSGAHKHDDKSKSASLGLHPDGISFKCFAGCQTDDFLKALGLTYNDLFPDKDKTPSSIYTYHNLDGSYHHDKLKYKDSAGAKTFRQRTIDAKGNVSWTAESGMPFRYPQLMDAIRNDKIILYTEGEKDCLTARLLGYESTTMGGASDWKDEYKQYFRNANIILIPDKDKPGLSLSAKMQQSLSTVVKSLRVVILPDGKDLTEWVEAGNRDLSPLINESPELSKGSNLPDPVITALPGGYTFAWNNAGITIKIDRLSDDCEGKITVYDKGQSIHVSKINMLAPRTLSEISKKLTALKKFQWDSALNRVAIYCSEQNNAVGALVDVNESPETMELRYLLDPLFPVGQPVTIFTSGGKGKSTLADYFCVLLQFGICAGGGLPFIPCQANVLILDWESDEQTHKRYITAIKRGLQIEDKTPIRYLALEHPLANVADAVRNYIDQYNIEFIVIDSQMAATANGTRGLTDAQVASEYYNVLRSFKCSTLTLDHVTKQNMSDDTQATSPYGSIVKYNRARSQFELKLPDDEDDSDTKKYVLVHKKFNLGRRLKPIGIQADYENNGNELIKIAYKSCDIKQSESLSKSLTRPMQIYAFLTRQTTSKATAQTIADGTNISYKDVTSLLSKFSSGRCKSPLFVPLQDGHWGAITNINNS